MTQNFPKEKKVVGSKVSKKQAVGIVVFVVLLVTGISLMLFFGGFLGSIFQPPAPPAEFAEGYAIIEFSDPYNGGLDVTDVDIYVQYMNGSNYLTVKDGEAFLVPEASYFFAIKNGYWNVSGAVLAKGDTSEDAYEQTYSIYKIPLETSINFTIIAIDNVHVLPFGLYMSNRSPKQK